MLNKEALHLKRQAYSAKTLNVIDEVFSVGQ
jgi:hypothetical protein